jgi:hypothetical protein
VTPAAAISAAIVAAMATGSLEGRGPHQRAAADDRSSRQGAGSNPTRPDSESASAAARCHIDVPSHSEHVDYVALRLSGATVSCRVCLRSGWAVR